MELSILDGVLEILVTYSDVPTVTLRGEVDFRNMSRVREAICSLVEHGKSPINVDVRELVFMDSTGISALIDAANTATPRGSEIRLLSPSVQLAKVINESGVSQVIRCSKVEEHLREVSCIVQREAQDKMDFEVPGRPEMLAHIRARVAEFACSLPFTGDEIEDIKLAVGEAGSNAIRHGSTCESSRVCVKMERCEDCVRIFVIDRGCGFDPNSVCNPSPGELRENGRGIMFMKILMDEVIFTFCNPGTCVEMVKRFKSS